MKYIVYACLLLTGIDSGCSQDLAYLKVINAIGLDAPSYLSINGNKFNSGKPVPSGRASGVIALKPGDYNISVENADAKKSKRTAGLKLEPGSTTGLVFFVDMKKDPEESSEKKEFPFLNHIVLQGNDKVGTPRVTLISLAKEPQLSIRIGGKSYQIGKGRPLKIPVKKRQVLEITSMSNQLLGGISVDKPIHYLGFIYNINKAPGYGVITCEHKNQLSKVPVGEGRELELLKSD